MQKVLTAEEMREVDRLTTERYGIPSLLLMENAAHAAARVIAEKLGGSVAGKSFLILCGKGNNGGDGAALARILWNQGASVEVCLLGKVEETKDDARVNFQILKSLHESFERSGDAHSFWFYEYPEDSIEEIPFGNEIFIDAVFGTGLAKPIQGKLAEYIDIYQEFHRKRAQLFVSIDIPSGLNANLAKKIGANFQADLTVTFTAPKLANVLPPAAGFNGELVTVNIGSPQELIDNSPSQVFVSEKPDAQKWLRETGFSDDSHKTARGRAMIVAGSRNMPGAAVLAANAAMISGAGLIRVVTAASAQTAVAVRTVAEALVAGVAETESGAISEDALAEVQKFAEKADVLAVGSGLSSDEETTKKFVRRLIEERTTPILIDADGLNALAPFDLKGSDELPLILTPHIGEMRKLMGVEDDFDFSERVEIAREFAREHQVVLMLKGERSLIAAPDGRVVINPTGNSGLGKAGSGDTLAGIITGFVAQTLAAEANKAKFKENPASRIEAVFEAVVAAMYIAGMAGDIAAEKIGKRSMTATDVRGCLRDAFERLEEK